MKAVILAAGLGTRFFPATKSQAKEMLPIVDKPCIQYLVEEAVKSGIKDIIIVTGGNKQSIKDYFTPSKYLHAELKKRKNKQALKEIKHVEKLAKITFVTQKHPLGDGHAILCAKPYIKNETFAVLFGDDIYDSNTPALKQLILKYRKHKTPIIGLQQIDKKDSHKYGMAALDNNNAILKLVEKPSPTKAPSNLAVIGKYIVTPELFKDLQKAKPTKSDKELRLIDGMIAHIKHAKIHGHEIKGQRFDTGDKLGYLKAVLHFGLKHSDFGPSLKKFIK